MEAVPRRFLLPDDIGDHFAVVDAYAAGVGRGRLRSADLARPFHGVRARADPDPLPEDPYERATAETLRLARAYATRMRADEFFAYATAAQLYGAPIPTVLGREVRPLDVGVFGSASLPRCEGVRGRRLTPEMTSVVMHDGFRLASPGSTWAMLGSWSLIDLVALGDYFCRVWRDGVGRRDVGRAPLATREQLSAALGAGRRRGAPRLRQALSLIREDAWSPRESACRVRLVLGGFPEPELNADVFDSAGSFLGCFDMVFRRWRVAVEYQGRVHGERYSHDVERVERARHAGWSVVQVTSTLHADPPRLLSRVGSALRSRGWTPGSPT